MITYNEKAWKDCCLNRIASEPGYLSLLRECTLKMNAGYFASGRIDWANIFVQKWNDQYDVFDAHCFLELWAKLHMRQIVCVPVGPVPPPKSDRDKEFNNGVISTLQPPFTGKFFGGAGDSPDA
jgi:hypothetical protein